MRDPATLLGNGVLTFIREVGAITSFLLEVIWQAFKKPYRGRLILEQMEFVGVGSLFIVLLTGTFTGAVFTLQTVAGLERVGMENVVGSTVMLAVSRELAPVLTALMVTGRVGSAMATELGTMRVTEQIDAMEVMAVDPIKYLIVPRIVASSIMVPALTVLFMMVAGVGAYVVGVLGLGLDEGAFFARIEWLLDPYDFMHGMLKAIVFGVLIALVGCYKGYMADGGARGVGMATTQAVVIGSISVFIIDYFLTSMLLPFAPT